MHHVVGWNHLLPCLLFSLPSNSTHYLLCFHSISIDSCSLDLNIKLPLIILDAFSTLLYDRYIVFSISSLQMNSFALHLVVLLLIGSYSIEANNEYTTQKPPSLPSPPVVLSLSTIPTRLAHDHHDDKPSSDDDGILTLHRQTTKT